MDNYDFFVNSQIFCIIINSWKYLSLSLSRYGKGVIFLNVENKEGGGINYTFLHFIKTQHVENSGI